MCSARGSPAPGEVAPEGLADPAADRVVLTADRVVLTGDRASRADPKTAVRARKVYRESCRQVAGTRSAFPGNLRAGLGAIPEEPRRATLPRSPAVAVE